MDAAARSESVKKSFDSRYHFLSYHRIGFPVREVALLLALTGLLALSGCIGLSVTEDVPSNPTIDDDGISNRSSMEDGTLIISRTSSKADISKINCPWVGVTAVLDRLHNKSEDLEGVTVATRTENGQPVLQVSRVTSYNREGTVISRPSISHQRLTALTPEEARVTVAANGRVERCQMPVVVQNESQWED
jgi:hypothetical protein